MHDHRARKLAVEGGGGVALTVERTVRESAAASGGAKQGATVAILQSGFLNIEEQSKHTPRAAGAAALERLMLCP